MDGKNSLIRIVELDAIRGIAALMVVLYHYTTWYVQSVGFSSTAPLFEFWQGKLGVYLFFIVSGFVIFLTLEKCDNISQFIVSRVARLYPAYWICVLITFSILYFTPIPGREVNAYQLLINLTMSQKFLRVAPIDGVYWTLAVELVFYFYMGLYLKAKRFLNIKLLSLFYLTICAIFARASELQFMMIPSEVRFLLLLDYGYFFVAGIMFYLMMTEKIDNLKVINILLSLFCASVQHFENIMLMFLFYGIFVFLVYQKLKFLNMSLLIWLGKISYVLYLIHQNVGYVIISKLEVYGGANSVTVILLPLVLSICVSVAIHRLIEVPARQSIKGAYLRYVARES